MLIAVYDGHHSLDLKNLFRDTVWNLLYDGSASVGDPRVNCLSHFKKICSEIGVNLDDVISWNRQNPDWISYKQNPYLFVISGNTSLEVSQILEFVENGSNLLVIPPPQQIVENITRGSLSDYHEYFLETLNKQLKFPIQKVGEQDLGKGRVFYISDGNEVNDLLLEPGPLGLTKQSEKEVKKEKIRLLVRRVTTFKVPCISCKILSVPSCWPQDEHLVIQIEVIQRSNCVIEDAIITIEIHSSFEPLSTTEVQFKNLHPNSRFSFAFLAVPRCKGIYDDAVNILVKFYRNEQKLFLLKSQIEVIESLPQLLKSSRPTSVDLSSALPKYEAKLQPLTTASNLIDLLNIDPDAVVAKVRRIGEHLCKSIGQRHLPSYNRRWTFAETTKQLFDAKILNSKAKGYIDTIRAFGNMASHADETSTISFDREDALSVCYALVLFLKEVTEDNVI